jgi:hypothetical protein
MQVERRKVGRPRPTGRIDRRGVEISVLVAVAVLGLAGPAFGYVGPGAGVTALGTVIALVVGLVLGIVGFVWYPVKRLRAHLRRKRQARES